MNKTWFHRNVTQHEDNHAAKVLLEHGRHSDPASVAWQPRVPQDPWICKGWLGRLGQVIGASEGLGWKHYINDTRGMHYTHNLTRFGRNCVSIPNVVHVLGILFSWFLLGFQQATRWSLNGNSPTKSGALVVKLLNSQLYILFIHACRFELLQAGHGKAVATSTMCQETVDPGDFRMPFASWIVVERGTNSRVMLKN